MNNRELLWIHRALPFGNRDDIANNRGALVVVIHRNRYIANQKAHATPEIGSLDGKS